MENSETVAPQGGPTEETAAVEGHELETEAESVTENGDGEICPSILTHGIPSVAYHLPLSHKFPEHVEFNVTSHSVGACTSFT